MKIEVILTNFNDVNTQ